MPLYADGLVLIAKRLLPADSTNIVDVHDNSAGTKPIKIEVLRITTDNSADRILTLYIYSDSMSRRYGSVTVPDLSGSNGSTDPAIDVIARLGTPGADGVICIWLLPGCKLQVALDAALAANKIMDVIGRGLTYS